MPPKNNSKNGAKGKKKADDDDFDAVLAAAVKATKSDAAKNHATNGSNSNSVTKGSAGTVHVSLADREAVVPSSADHPENPYSAVASGCVRQTWPEPTVPVSKQFSNGQYPAGDIVEYTGECNAFRHSDAEKRVLERASESEVQDLRRAAEVHRQVRTWAQSWIKPGISLMLLTDRIEKKLKELIEKDGLQAGQAFPTGCSLNNVAAHYTPNSGDKVVLTYDDVMKIDFGTHVNGRIIDCAWTVAFNEQYNPLLDAVREATNEGIRQAGIDVRLGDIGAAIEEVMESHEVEINGKVHTVRSIRNLSGHSISSTTIVHRAEAHVETLQQLLCSLVVGMGTNGRTQSTCVKKDPHVAARVQLQVSATTAEVHRRVAGLTRSLQRVLDNGTNLLNAQLHETLRTFQDVEVFVLRPFNDLLLLSDEHIGGVGASRFPTANGRSAAGPVQQVSMSCVDDDDWLQQRPRPVDMER